MKTSLDNLNPEANEKYSAALSQFFHEKLGTPSDRGYM
jgi:phenylpyruvate tautomerase